jgi:hypothetical protein
LPVVHVKPSTEFGTVQRQNVPTLSLYRTVTHMLKALFFAIAHNFSGPRGVASIVTGYGLDDPGIESRWRRDFPHLSRPALGSTQPSVQWVPGLSRGKERPGRDSDPSPFSSARGHERVELYLYSPYGPYGLYRASVPVQGCTLPLLYIILPMCCLFVCLFRRRHHNRVPKRIKQVHF